MQPSFWYICLTLVPPLPTPHKNTTLKTWDFLLHTLTSFLVLFWVYIAMVLKLTAWHKCNFWSVSVHILARREQLVAYRWWRGSKPERKSSTPGLISCSSWLAPPRLSGRAVFSLYTGWNQNGPARHSPGCVWLVREQIGLQEARLESIISSFKIV
jgi:hypothetical protein